MATLNFVTEELSEDPIKKNDVDQCAFRILRDFLQPDSQQPVSSTATSILALLPHDDPEASVAVEAGSTTPANELVTKSHY